MKKAITCTLLLAMLLTLLVGCGSSMEQYSAAGNYLFTAFKSEGEQYDSSKVGGYYALKLEPYGKGAIETGTAEEPESGSITWSQIGNAITINAKDQTLNGTLHGNSIQLEINHVTLIFTLQ